MMLRGGPPPPPPPPPPPLVLPGQCRGSLLTSLTLVTAVLNSRAGQAFLKFKSARGCSSDAALRRMREDIHQTTYDEARAYTLGVDRWNRSHSVQKHASNPVCETQLYSDNKHDYRREINKYGRESTLVSEMQMCSDNSCGYRRDRNRYTNERNKTGCLNCGEFNHVQRNCRFDHKLLFGNCRRLGHKSRLCQQYRA